MRRPMKARGSVFLFAGAALSVACLAESDPAGLRPGAVASPDTSAVGSGVAGGGVAGVAGSSAGLSGGSAGVVSTAGAASAGMPAVAGVSGTGGQAGTATAGTSTAAGAGGTMVATAGGGTGGVSGATASAAGAMSGGAAGAVGAAGAAGNVAASGAAGAAMSAGGMPGAGGMSAAGGAGGASAAADPIELYNSLCSTCHGDMGQGIDNTAPEIQHPVRDFATWVIRNGRSGLAQYPDPMAAFNDVLLSDDTLNGIFDFLDSVPQPTTGEGLYTDYCGNCHGPGGAGGPAAHDINREPASQLIEHARRGANLGDMSRRSGYMPQFTADMVSDAEIQMIFDYLSSP